MEDKRSKIELIKALNSRLNMRAVLAYYGIVYEDQGRDKFKVVCPFHNDHTPSLTIFTANESGHDSWMCWVCNDNGDCFRFIQTMTHNHTKSVETAQEILKGIGGDASAVDPRYKEAMEKQKLRKRAYLLDFKLGICYRDWLESLEGHVQYEAACKKVDAIWEELDNLTDTEKFQEAIDFIKEKIGKLKEMKK